ncbi:hypothetical protein OHA25_27375 [Nonomuraea sp. NBC_00507]|uniref:hypothetical protein n=1 Tax=Nonomuraea sp. NBC_00507 TaxID=2976002 RepID=UPI002E181CCE
MGRKSIVITGSTFGNSAAIGNNSGSTDPGEDTHVVIADTAFGHNVAIGNSSGEEAALTDG